MLEVKLPHGHATAKASARCRVACNLNHDINRIAKGAWLVTPDTIHMGRVFDAEVEWLANTNGEDRYPGGGANLGSAGDDLYFRIYEHAEEFRALRRR